jgi:hypothetical protein
LPPVNLFDNWTLRFDTTGFDFEKPLHFIAQLRTKTDDDEQPDKVSAMYGFNATRQLQLGFVEESPANEPPPPVHYQQSGQHLLSREVSQALQCIFLSLNAAPAPGGISTCADGGHRPLRLGSWDITDFTAAKAARPAVLAALGGISARYDVLSLQGLRHIPGAAPANCSHAGGTGASACDLLAAINMRAAPRSFELAASPWVCAGVACAGLHNGEQRAVVWDAARFELLAAAAYPARAPGAFVHGPPWAVHLRELATGLELAVLTARLSSAAATAEARALRGALGWAAAALTPNIVLVGDLRALDDNWPVLPPRGAKTEPSCRISFFFFNITSCPYMKSGVLNSL